MKLLLDEQVPRRLATYFIGHSVSTVQEMGWASVKNGELLKLAAANEFDALITADKNMEYQQNSVVLPITVIVMAPLRNRLSDLAPLVPGVLKILGAHRGAPSFYRIDI